MTIHKNMLGQQLIEQSPQLRVNFLRHMISCHSYLYHTLADPIISDHVYDTLCASLKHLEQEHPELATENSPAQLAGKTKAEVIQILRSFLRPQE